MAKGSRQKVACSNQMRGQQRADRIEMQNQINKYGKKAENQVTDLYPLGALNHAWISQPLRQTGDECQGLLSQHRHHEEVRENVVAVQFEKAERIEVDESAFPQQYAGAE